MQILKSHFYFSDINKLYETMIKIWRLRFYVLC